MTSVNHDRFLLSAWGVSLALHSAAVALAVTFAAQVKPVLQEEIFKWDVALVESAEVQPFSEPAEAFPTQSPPQAKPSPVPPVKPLPEVMHRVAPQQTVQIVHPVIEPSKPIEEKFEPPVQPKAEPAQPVEQKPAEVAPRRVEPVLEAKEPEPVQHAEPLVAQSPSVAVAPSAEAVEAQPSHREPPAPAPTVESAYDTPIRETEKNVPVSSEAPVDVPKEAAPSPEAPVQVAKAPTSSREGKIDHRWLAESLWRRVAELKRYPSAARLQGIEGKVVLKAIIRSDGHLVAVSVHKSSGHIMLDEAAIETVKQACPLHMKHELQTPQIVVNLPIVYSLAN